MFTRNVSLLENPVILSNNVRKWDHKSRKRNSDPHLPFGIPAIYLDDNEEPVWHTFEPKTVSNSPRYQYA